MLIILWKCNDQAAYDKILSKLYYGCIDKWLNGRMVTWLYSYTWLYGHMIVWLHGFMVTLLHRHMVEWWHSYMVTLLYIYVVIYVVTWCYGYIVG